MYDDDYYFMMMILFVDVDDHLSTSKDDMNDLLFALSGFFCGAV